MDSNNQIEAYLDQKRKLKFQEHFLIEKILPFIEERNKSLDILDLACGDGLLIRNLCIKFPYCNFEGFDLSDKLIEIASHK